VSLRDCSGRVEFPPCIAAAGHQSIHHFAACPRIEEELGADLFHREPGHGARLTEVGRAFLRDVREMFDNLDHAKTTALAVAYGKRGRLRLAASEDVMTGTLARIITAYREQWPDVHLTCWNCRPLHKSEHCSVAGSTLG